MLPYMSAKFKLQFVSAGKLMQTLVNWNPAGL